MKTKLLNSISVGNIKKTITCVLICILFVPLVTKADDEYTTPDYECQEGMVYDANLDWCVYDNAADLMRFKSPVHYTHNITIKFKGGSLALCRSRV